MGLSTIIPTIFLAFLTLGVLGNPQLSPNFYSKTCPRVKSIVRDVIERASRSDVNVNARLNRLHFHDCFVNGCDGSVLLDASPADGVEGEKDAFPNTGSLQGFEVVDDIKTALENVCPGVVSCADILAIAAEVSVDLTGGPSWKVPLGRRDGRRANRRDADNSLPLASDPLNVLTSKFSAVGLDTTDLVALSGAHTFGRVRCGVVVDRLYNYSGSLQPDPTVQPAFLQTLRRMCPRGGELTRRIDLDPTSPDTFDNNYFKSLQNNRGVIESDQALFSTTGSPTVSIVNRFARSQNEFFKSFARSMIKMGKIRTLTGRNGEIRKNCRRIN